MQNTINMNQVFSSLDKRKAEAEAVIAQHTPEAVAQASRIALIYNRCDVTSLKHKEDIAYYLTRN